MVKEQELKDEFIKYGIVIFVKRFKRVDHVIAMFPSGLTMRLFLKTKIENIPMKNFYKYLGLKETQDE